MMKCNVLVATAALVAMPALATTSVSGFVASGARATLGTNVDSFSSNNAAVAPNNTSLIASANANVFDLGYSNGVYVLSRGFWGSADAGNIYLQWGWAVAASGYGGTTVAETNLSYPANWSYTFTASGNGIFSGNYSVYGAGNTFGLQPLYTTFDWTSGTLGGDVFDPTGSGTFSVALISGNTYTMQVAQYGNVSNVVGFDSAADAVATIDWAITYAAIPEPASWALLIGGFVLTGAAMRRRRRQFAVA